MPKKVQIIFLVLFALSAIIGSIAPALASQEAPMQGNPHPQFSTAWYKMEVQTAVDNNPGDPFGAAVARMDTIWAFEAPFALQHEWPGAPGPILNTGDIFWGGWFDPANLPAGMVLLVCEPTNWACIYEVVEDNFQMPGSTAGGRALSGMNEVIYLPIINN
jgi:hypothetical protein